VTVLLLGGEESRTLRGVRWPSPRRGSGGLSHYVLVTMLPLPAARPRWGRRLVAILGSPVILGVVALFGDRPTALGLVIWPAPLALIGYGLVMRLHRASHLIRGEARPSASFPTAETVDSGLFGRPSGMEWAVLPDDLSDRHPAQAAGCGPFTSYFWRMT
jgi:hypothetical protein